MNKEYIKHPLQNEWHLWYWKMDKKEWIDNLVEIKSFRTIEDFWALYNFIELPGNLNIGTDYCLFKNGIKPMWEDSRNSKGGRWLFTFSKNSSRLLNEAWLEVILCLIGEAFGDESDQVCGAVVNIRAKADKISIWTSDCKEEKAVKKMGRILKERINFSDKMFYEAHENAIGRNSSKIRYLYQIE